MTVASNTSKDAIREAVLAVLKRRTSMSAAMLAKLDRRMQRSDLGSMTALHDWVRQHDKLDPALRQFLQRVLAPADMSPFGDFQAVAHLADGGMGSVWLCAQSTGELAVVKTLRHDVQDKQFFARFAREAQITCALRSPHIVTALGHSGDFDRVAWLALEYIAGGDLNQVPSNKECCPRLNLYSYFAN